MRFYLKQQVIGHAIEVPISDSEFEGIRKAREKLSAAFDLEGSYDLLISNYIELEQELLTAAAVTLVRDAQDYKDFFEPLATINRRTVNLLTACRLYLDQAPQRLSSCAHLPDDAKLEFKNILSGHYDASSSYRFLEALRNHVQHCGSAVHKLSIGPRWTGTLREASVQPFALRRHLEEDGKFKTAVLREAPDEVNLIQNIREYLQCLGAAHKYIRDTVEPAAKNARAILQQHINQYSAENAGETVGLAAVRSDPPHSTQTISIFLDWDDVRLQLIQRNHTLINLSKCFVTGKATQ